MKFKYTKSIKDHLRYSWWIYILVLIAVFFIADISYTVSEPKIPHELKIEIVNASNMISEEFVEKLDSDITNHFGDEVKKVDYMDYTIGLDEATLNQILFVKFAAKEGDIFILDLDNTLRFMSMDILYKLDTAMLDTLKYNKEIIMGQSEEDETNQVYLYAISIKNYPKLLDYGFDEDSFIALPIYCKNIDGVFRLLEWAK